MIGTPAAEIALKIVEEKRREESKVWIIESANNKFGNCLYLLLSLSPNSLLALYMYTLFYAIYTQ